MLSKRSIFPNAVENRFDTFFVAGRSYAAPECELPEQVKRLFASASTNSASESEGRTPFDKPLRYPSYVHDRQKMDVWPLKSPAAGGPPSFVISQRFEFEKSKKSEEKTEKMASVHKSSANDGNYFIEMIKPASGLFEAHISGKIF